MMQNAKLTTVGKSLDRYCVTGGGSFWIAYPPASLARTLRGSLARGTRDRVVLVLASSPRFSLNAIKPGNSEATARRPRSRSTEGSSFGHVRQLDALLGRALQRAWQAGAGPGAERLVIDVDSFVGGVCGATKQGAGYGYTRVFGYHPILATRADTREALHIRLRHGSANTQRGIKRFCDELIARVERAGAGGPVLLRADSGFWNTKVFQRLEQAGWQYSIGVRNVKAIQTALATIDEQAWHPIAYPEGGEAQIAETVYAGRRLIVRRTRLLGPQAELWPDWRHFCLITNRTDELVTVEAEHREHAVVEQVIADLKDQALAHFPSGHFHANGAWTVLAALAHNLLRWTQQLGLPDTTVRAARTLRRRLLELPGRLTTHARGWTLHLPARWPWHSDYLNALNRIRALPPAT